MRTACVTAAAAIVSSGKFDYIAYCEDTAENRAELAQACDDSTDTGSVLEYWANDPQSTDGMLWRVHIVKTDF